MAVKRARPHHCASSTRLHDCLSEELLSRDEKVADDERSGRLTEEGDVVRITPEVTDIRLNLQSNSQREESGRRIAELTHSSMAMQSYSP